MNTPYSRRAFLTRGITLASAAWTVPAFIDLSARALAAQVTPGHTSNPGAADDRILVVIQLAGGNDGLNTVVPFAEPAYYKSRPAIAVPQDQVLRLSGSDGVGLHPKLNALRELYDEGQLSIIQGVGYPNPNRSHFKSMDIWHTADLSGTGEGWLGRYFDNQCCGTAADAAKAAQDLNGDAGIALGRTAPLAMEGRRFKPIAFETPDLFRWTGEDIDDEKLHEAYRALSGVASRANTAPANTPTHEPDTAASFLTRTSLDAQVASDRIRRAVERKPETEYPRTPLARQLMMVASMIAAELPTRVYYVSLGGFDTHAGQGGVNGTQANLLETFAQALKAFYADLRKQENDARVLTMTFSEFGRRVGQNASAGTDHGTAAPMFLAGPMVRPGVLGNHPSLTDLDNGDLKFTADFRSVYAGILQQWLRADPEKVLEGRFAAAKVVKG
ncbi:MAG: DUF1501 domain-containing protein [Phycisphaerales bacterium]